MAAFSSQVGFHYSCYRLNYSCLLGYITS